MKVWALNQISPDEKDDILSKHRSLYNGYQTMQPKVENTLPLYEYDPAQDKIGVVMSNKGVVKPYTNFGINKDEVKEVCDECGAMMMEGECSECGWKGEIGEAKGVCSECGSQMNEGECTECGHLDDIYHVSDLNPNAEFDYTKGSKNKDNTFEKMHKNLYKESADDYFDNFEDPDNEDDGFEDLNASEVTDEIEEQGGNVGDMDVDDVESAYDFDSEGPGLGSAYPVNEYDDEEYDEKYEPMKSAWADELDEVDVSGSQGIYGDMDPAFDFDSNGPGIAGPYQHSSWGGGSENKDPGQNEFNLDLDEFDPRDKSWEEIKAHTNDDSDWDDVDEDLKESFLTQKKKISEMFNRFNKYN